MEQRPKRRFYRVLKARGTKIELSKREINEKKCVIGVGSNNSNSNSSRSRSSSDADADGWDLRAFE